MCVPRLAVMAVVSFSSFAERRDWQRFADAYADPDSGIHIANRNPIAFPTITGELTYIGAEAVERDIAGTKHALEGGRQAGVGWFRGGDFAGFGGPCG